MTAILQPESSLVVTPIEEMAFSRWPYGLKGLVYLFAGSADRSSSVKFVFDRSVSACGGAGLRVFPTMHW